MTEEESTTIIVTGGAGFIGSALVRYLINETNHKVVNFDKLTYAGNLNSLKPIENSKRYVYEQGDICNEHKLIEILTKYKPASIMHLAAESHVDRSIDGPDSFIETNIIGTYKLLKASLTHFQSLTDSEKSQFRFLHVSTDEVYGDLDANDPSFDENHPYEPSSPYSASKAASDHLVKAWCRTYGLPILLTNCSNNYGPFHFPEKFIPHMILNALEGQNLPVYGDGLQIRDWLYVDDHVKALYAVLQKGKIGETYNIGGSNEVANIEVVNKICTILEQVRPANRPYSNLITHVKDRPGHDRRYAINNAKITNEIGWQPQETFETGLSKTVQWFLDNQGWWQDILSGNYKLDRLGH